MAVIKAVTIPIHKRIRHLIVSKKIPFKDAAIKANIPVGRFYRVMDGTSRMYAEELEQICSITELATDLPDFFRTFIPRI